MTRLASLCAAALEVANAVAVRVEDVVGEWVDGWAPQPLQPTRERERQSLALLARWNDDSLIEWSGEGGTPGMRSRGRGAWVFGVSNGEVAQLIDDTAVFFGAKASQ